MLEDLPDGFLHALLLLLPGNDSLRLSRVSKTLRRRVFAAPALNAGVTVGVSMLEVRLRYSERCHPYASTPCELPRLSHPSVCLAEICKQRCSSYASQRSAVLGSGDLRAFAVVVILR